MKKQILILMMLTLAIIFAGTNNVFAQPSSNEVDYMTDDPSYCVSPTPLTCGTADDPLSPLPGVPYDYTITSSSVGTIHWFVTDDANIITAGGLVAGIEPSDGSGDYILDADAAYNDATNTSLTVNITWKSFDGAANNVLLVAYNIDDEGCTNNIEVYRIQPQYSFTLDIAGILDDGTEGNEECVSPIVSATYDDATSTLNVDYGTNYVFFTVNAANWQASWRPQFNVTTDGDSDLGTPQWAYYSEATTGGVWRDAGTDVEADQFANNDNGFIGSEGACIIVRVPVDHAALTENITDETITLIVNGEMINPEGLAYDGTYPDLDNDPDGGTDCVDDYDDSADFVITPRPDINEDEPNPFENKAPRD
jgi:hypothetical protein